MVWHTTINISSLIKLFGPQPTRLAPCVCQHKTTKWNDGWKGDNVLFVKARHVDFPPSVGKTGQERNRLGITHVCQTLQIQLNFAFWGRLKYHMLLFRVMLCHLIVWKVVVTHVRSGQLYLVGAKYCSSVQNIDSAQLVEWGDEGSFEAQWLNWRGIPKIPILLNLLYCPRLAGWMMVASRGAHCSAKKLYGTYSRYYGFLFFERSTTGSRG